jgi:hypothetical protein
MKWVKVVKKSFYIYNRKKKQEIKSVFIHLT